MIPIAWPPGTKIEVEIQTDPYLCGPLSWQPAVVRSVLELEEGIELALVQHGFIPYRTRSGRSGCMCPDGVRPRRSWWQHLRDRWLARSANAPSPNPSDPAEKER
jgi:hypothetical protein